MRAISRTSVRAASDDLHGGGIDRDGRRTLQVVIDRVAVVRTATHMGIRIAATVSTVVALIATVGAPFKWY